MILLTSPSVQMGAAFEGFFWPKIFWDHFTHGLDGAVKPVPILQIINMILGIFTFAFEYPVGILTNNSLHRSIVARLVWIPFTATAAVLLYQGPDACGWYLIGLGAYGWAYMEGEVRTSLYLVANSEQTILTNFHRAFALSHGPFLENLLLTKLKRNRLVRFLYHVRIAYHSALVRSSLDEGVCIYWGSKPAA